MTDRPTPTKVWKEVHSRLLRQLKLPCKLVYSNEFRVGGHIFTDQRCSIVVNPKVPFKVPEHLILHEAAHHMVIAEERCRCTDDLPFTGHHCEHWAKTLLDIYGKTGTSLPHGTQFEMFAKIAGLCLITREAAIRLP